MRFGETMPSPGQRRPERFDPKRTVFGSFESGFSHMPRPGDLGTPREKPAPTALDLISESVKNLQASAKSAREALRVTPEQRAMRIAVAGGLEERLAQAKAISQRLESQAMASQREADVLSRGMEALMRNQSPAPEFRSAVEEQLAQTAQELQRSRARDKETAPSIAGYESENTKQARQRLKAFQELLDKMDKLAV